jgi:hypothetical protein
MWFILTWKKLWGRCHIEDERTSNHLFRYDPTEIDPWDLMWVSAMSFLSLISYLEFDLVLRSSMLIRSTTSDTIES